MDVRIIAVYMILLVGNIEAAGKCNSPVNIAAVIDVSDNLSPSNLPEIKNFLKRVANFFLLSTHASHMSVILAGSQVNVAIDPVSGVGSSKVRFIKAVETSVKHSGGAWSVDEGLGLAKKVFTGSRNFVPRVALVLTNGRQSNGNSSDVLKSRARDLHAMGVYVYVVSVGDGVSRDELRLMVKDDSEYLYHVDHFKDLDTLAVNVSSDICQKHYIGSFAVCKTKVDVGVIVDSSGSIRSDEYLGVKKFVQAISVYMGFLPVNGTHVGVVVYSKDARVWTKFGQQANFRKLFRILGRMPHYRDLTRIDLGLDVANTKLFTKEDGMREDAHKIAILFTDGEQTTENVNDLIPLKEVASRLKDRGIVLFAVGIGEKVKRSQLLEIASGEEYVIMIESFSALRESATKIAALACQVVDPPVINFTQSVYDVNEDRKAVIGISVTQGKVIAPLTVSIHPSPATADNDDFFASVQNVTFQPGETRKQIEIEVVDDLKVEPTESFVLSLASSSPAILGEPSSVNIIDNDAVINFTRPVFNVREDEEKAKVGISVTAGVMSKPVTVRITPMSDTAGEDDFDSTPKDVTFQPGETGPKYVNIDLIDDTDYEPTEKFTVSLSSNSRVVLGGPSTVNIQDDDPPPPPMIEFTQPSYSASESGTVPVAISVTRDKVTEPVTVRVTPRRDTAGEDDFDSTPKDVTFQPGETGPKYVNIDLVDDTDYEPTEKFTVSLSSNSRVVLGGPSTVNIQDDDVPPPPMIEFTQPSYSASESGKVRVAISVTRDKVTEPVTVRVTPRRDTADEDDFDSTPKDVMFQPGETGPKYVNIDLVDDTDYEPTEKFTVSLSSNSRVVLGGPSTVNIQDDDVPPPPMIEFTQPSYSASESGTVPVAISVTRDKVTEPVTVRVTPRRDTADEDDFDSTPKDVTFQPGETGPKYVNIDLVDDTDYEPTEKFTVSLSSNSRVVLGGPSTVNIQDDDVPPPPMIEFTQPSYSASESGEVRVAISVTRDKVTEPVTVRVTPRRDTADEDDFDSTPKDVTFQPGETGPKYVNIDLVDDTDYEPTEKFTVSLSSNSRVLVGGPSTVNIQDDDVPPPPMIEFTQPSYSASESGKVRVAISVTRDKVTEPVTVRVTPRRDTADEDDFDSTPKDVTFQPGETGPKYVNIDLVDDPDDEPTENFTVSLSSNSRVLVGGPSTVNIQDDDVAKICGTSRDDCDENALCADVRPGYFECFCNDGYAGDGKYCAEIRIGFTKSEYNANEDDGSAEVQLIVTSGAITKPVTVTVQPDPDTASSLDFNNAPVKVTFQPGQKGPKSVVFDIIDDNEVEEDESVKVSLSSGDPVGLDKPTYVRIVDNDEPICKTDKHNCHKFAVCNDTGPGLHECTCQEGYSGDGKSCQVISFRFTNPVYDVKENEKPFVEIQLGTGEITKAVDIEVRTIMGTADDEDFIPVSKFVTFQPGERKKIVGIDLVDDDVVEPTEEFTVRLSSSTRAAFGSPATVRIADNDAEICDMDIGFLVDSTASMRDCNFKKEKDFVKKIAGYFQVAPGATRTSTIVYGGDALLAKKFNETKSLKDFQTEIDNIPFKGGRANLDAAMHLAASAMFTVKNGMRESVPKVLVVLNDGAQKVITQSAKDISSMLRKNEVRVIVIGVGEAEHDLLAQIVASPEDLIMTEKFDDATENLVSLFKRICSKRDNSSCRILKKKVDDLKIGGCMSEKPVEIGVCGGHCSSFSNFVKRNGFYEMDCGCCKAKTKVTVTVDLKCSMNTYQAFKIRSAESCSCESCESRPVEIIKK